MFGKILFLALAMAGASFAAKPESTPKTQAPPFRFHLISEPGSLKPWEQKNSSSSYLLSQITGTLMTYQDHKLTPNLAESCKFKTPKIVTCTLRKKLQWSNGKALKAQDFVRSFQALLDPKNKAFRADILFPILNAPKVYKGQAPISNLKVKTRGDRKLEIELSFPDSEFLYTLTNPLTAPIPETALRSLMEIREKPSLWLSSGAYEIQSWDPQKKIELKPNPRFWKKGPRPNLEVLMINEDSVALSLYEKGELSLLRRLPSLFIPKYKDRPDFFEVEQIRFDYFGFSPKWKEMPEIRRAISRAIPYSEWQKLYQSKGLPGCAGLPSHLMTESVCLTFDPVEAQAEWQPLRNRPKKFEVLYSKQGGDDHKRTMEWLQAEILKNLNFTLEVNGIENHIFLQRLEKNPPDMFRKGVAPERPTCVSALENFETGNSENYIQFSDPRFDQLLKQMRETASLSQKQKLCTQALHLLVDPAWVIPTGPIHFTLLASPQWMGWKLNELNQLDLSELRLKTSVDAKPKQR